MVLTLENLDTSVLKGVNIRTFRLQCCERC